MQLTKKKFWAEAKILNVISAFCPLRTFVQVDSVLCNLEIETEKVGRVKHIPGPARLSPTPTINFFAQEKNNVKNTVYL